MFFEIIVAILIGCILGTITGITPGLHINLVSVIILSITPVLLKYFSPVSLAVIIIAMSITHTFTDFLPSIFLGAANDDTALSVLPGHQLLMQGKSLLAIKLTVIGGFFSVFFALILSPLFIFSTKIIYEFLKPFIGYLLIIFSILLIVRNNEKNKIFWSLAIFLLSGILGLIVLNSNFKEPLLPMLSGIFGVSILIYSMFQKAIIPAQHKESEKIPLKETIRPTIAGTLSAMFVSIFPAVGPSHAAIISQQFLGKVKEKGYMIMLGSINTVSMIFSLITLYTIEKARNGSIIVVQKLLEKISLEQLILFFVVVVISAAIASFITLELGKSFAEIISSINYAVVSSCVIAFIVLLVIVFSGLSGLFILIIATAIGLIPNAMKTERTSAMGCLLVPVIVYFLV